MLPLCVIRLSRRHLNHIGAYVYIHSHERIAKGCGLYTKMSEEQKDFLALIRDMNIEARYQEFKDAAARNLNSENTAEILNTTKQLHAWILHEIEEKL